MVRKMIIVNVIVGILLLIAAVSGARAVMIDIKEHGYEYEETVVVGNKIEIRKVSNTSNVASIILLGLMFICSVLNVMDMREHRYRLVWYPGEETGITFPLGDPEFWRVEGDLENRVVQVWLNDFSIRVPVETIFEWFQPEDKGEDVK